MSTVSIIAVVILVVFASLDSSVDATTILIHSSSTAALTAAPAVTPSSSSTQPAPAQSVTPTPTTSAGGAAAVTSSPSVAPPEAPGKTCGNIKFMVMGNESMYTNQTELQSLLEKGVFHDSSKYEDVKVSNLTFSTKEGKEEVQFKLCVVVKKDDAGYIEDMLKDGLKNDKVEVTEFKFTGDGVSFKDWKVKGDECNKCSGGGAGPIVIVRTCVAEAGYSCTGLKNKEEESNDCVKYCDSSAAAIMMSSFILAMGILISFSFNTWK